MASPSSGDMLSPTSSGGFVRRAAPEPNKRALYVGGLDPRVTEEVLRQIFETTGHVQSVKIIPDKTVSSTILPATMTSSYKHHRLPRYWHKCTCSTRAFGPGSVCCAAYHTKCLPRQPVAKRNFTTVSIEGPQLRLR